MSSYKKLEDLDVLSNFMFNAIATDEHVAKPFFRIMLSILLEKEIGDITVTAQSFIQGDTPLHRGIRMDVKITEHADCPAECKIYNVEPQLYTEPFLPKRVRFYQAKKDSKALHSGEKDWNKLPDLYMIIITNYDPFHEDSMVYTINTTCKEFPDMPYDDGLKIIYFNVNGTKNCKESIKQLLSYLNHSKIENVTNDSIAQLHNCVNDVKQNGEMEERFMTFGEIIDYERAEAKEEGRIEGLEIGRIEGLKTGRIEGLKTGRIEGLETGHSTGLRSALLEILHDLGDIPDDFSAKLMAADDNVLTSWIKLAVKAENLDDFLNQII